MERTNEQRQEMLELYLSGKRLRVIGEIFGITYERVRQVITVFPEYREYKRGKDIKCICGKVFYVDKSRADRKSCSRKCSYGNKKRIPLDERFWAKVNIRGKNECWEWIAGKIPQGYGKIRLGGRNDGYEYAHRVCWELKRGKIPKGMHILHSCDNPSCMNPNHLRLGTHQDNIRDRGEKGRTRNQYSGKLFANKREICYNATER